MGALNNNWNNLPGGNFPLGVVASATGWVIALYNSQQAIQHILKPGGPESGAKPYTFETQQEGWHFVKSLIRYRSNYRCSKKSSIENCKQCGQIFKSTSSRYCRSCLQESDYLLQQMSLGIYHKTGSPESTMDTLSFLLNTPAEELVHRMKNACGTPDSTQSFPGVKEKFRVHY